MKQYLSVEDLNSLSDSQKQTLNSLWLPEKYDRVVASVCKDAENDIYEDFEFIVGEIILSDNTRITLRRLKLQDEVAYENIAESLENELMTDDDELDINFDDPGDYFMKENCLPLLSIGQLISFLRNTKAGQNGFSISIPASNDRVDQIFTFDDVIGEAGKADELVDLLFDLLKSTL